MYLKNDDCPKATHQSAGFCLHNADSIWEPDFMFAWLSPGWASRVSLCSILVCKYEPSPVPLASPCCSPWCWPQIAIWTRRVHPTHSYPCLKCTTYPCTLPSSYHSSSACDTDSCCLTGPHRPHINLGPGRPDSPQAHRPPHPPCPRPRPPRPPPQSHPHRPRAPYFPPGAPAP